MLRSDCPLGLIETNRLRIAGPWWPCRKRVRDSKESTAGVLTLSVSVVDPQFRMRCLAPSCLPVLALFLLLAGCRDTDPATLMHASQAPVPRSGIGESD